MAGQRTFRVILALTALGAALAVMLPGCSQKKEGPHVVDTFTNGWEERAKQSPGYSPPPTRRKIDFAKTNVVAPTQQKAKAPVKELPKQRVSLRMYNTDLVAVLRTLARAAGQNIVLSSSIAPPSGQANPNLKPVNINVSNTPWDEAFLSILGANNLTYTWDGNIVRVLTLDDLKSENEMRKVRAEGASYDSVIKSAEPFVICRVEIHYSNLVLLAATLNQMCGHEVNLTMKDGEPDTYKLVTAKDQLQGQGGGAAASGGGTGGGTGGSAPPQTVGGPVTTTGAPGATGPATGRLPGQLRGEVFTDPHSYSLIIQAPRDDAEKLVQLIEQLDQPRPQIALKAHIVESTRDAARQLGVQWGGGMKASTYNNNNIWVTPAGSRTTLNSPTTTTTTMPTAGSPVVANPYYNPAVTDINDPRSQQYLYYWPGNWPITANTNPTYFDPLTGQSTPVFGNTTANPVKGQSSQGFGLNFPADAINPLVTAVPGQGMALSFMYGMLGGNILELQLSALQSQGKLNVLSSPSITTMDNQKAYTENGKKVPYLSTSQNGTNVQFLDAVLRLEITPHIIDGKRLRMRIKVQNDQVDPNTSNWVSGNPPLYKKTTETNLIADNSETIVISGLSRNTSTDNTSGVPFAQDIPYLGWAFKNKNKSSNLEEILIFITPTILGERPVDPADQPSKELPEGPSTSVDLF